MPSRPIHVAANGKIPYYLWVSSFPLVCVYHIFIHLPTEEHLACFCNLAIVSNSQLAQWWVQSLGQEEPLEKGMATHFSILAWEVPWIEDPGGL